MLLLHKLTGDRDNIPASPTGLSNDKINQVLSMRSCISGALLLVFMFLMSACGQQRSESREFILPEGSAERGEAHFVSLGCVSCHSILNYELPEAGADGPVNVMLGSSTRITTYGDLVTSIVNPSHRLSPRYPRDDISSDGESLMVSNNDVMTVTQLTDLIAFLQLHYQKVSRPGYSYPTYDYSGSRSGNDD